MLPNKVKEFFDFARERQSVYLKRQRGEPWPWTKDPILNHYKFTNVFRENDRTTVWFRENVRNRMKHSTDVLLATVLFRYFNKEECGEVIFKQGLLSGETPWSSFLKTGDTSEIKNALKLAFPKGPYVTGAYMLRSPTGMPKLDGMLKLCSDFYQYSDWRNVANGMLPDSKSLEYHPKFDGPVTMENFTRWLQKLPGQGPFLAYEVTCDLQYTCLLDHAPDIMSWANVGPGCRRGLNRMAGRTNPHPRNQKAKNVYGVPIPEKQALEEMRYLLACSQKEEYWPQDWQKWDARTVEHTLCEFDKISRARYKEGTPKQIFRRR